jgi:hypothetical protein
MFEYKDFKNLGIEGKIKNVKFSRIVADEFSSDGENVNHRPVRDPHVNKIFHSYSGVDVPITVALNREDKMYHIVDGNHRWFNLKRLISLGHKKQPFRLPCLVVYDEETQKKLDISIPKDRERTNEISFCSNEGNERTCIIDKINQVWRMAKKYLLLKEYDLKGGKKLPDGTSKYVSDNWKGYEKMSLRNIEKYILFAKRLYINGLLEKAINERWVESRIIQELDIISGRIKIKTYPITIHVSKKELSDDENIKKLSYNYIHWDKHLLRKLNEYEI